MTASEKLYKKAQPLLIEHRASGMSIPDAWGSIVDASTQATAEFREDLIEEAGLLGMTDVNALIFKHANITQERDPERVEVEFTALIQLAKSSHKLMSEAAV